MKKNEIVFFGVCVAFFSFMWYEALDLTGKGRAGELGSGSWPLMALTVATLLSVILLIQSVVRFRKEGEDPDTLTPDAVVECCRQRNTVTFSVICFLGYLVLIPVIGFILSTFLFIPLFALALGERRRSVLIVSPFLLTIIIIGVFAKFITIPFPKGIGIFAQFSRIFY